MKLIIDISKNEYNDIVEQVKKCDYPDMGLGKIIANGKPYEARPQGEWIPKQSWDNTHIWVCSECGNQNKHGITTEKACWKCGADMRGEE